MALVSKQSKSDLLFNCINTLFLISALVIAVYPLLFVVIASISDPVAVLQGKVILFPIGFSLNAYQRVFQNHDIMMGYKNTIIYTLVGTTVNVIMTIMGAYPLSRKDFKARNILTILITFSMLFNAGLIPNYLVIKSLGLVNNFWVMILPSAVAVWNLIIMRTFFQNGIPTELHEAAFLDGCSNVGVLIRIILPLSGPVIAVMVLFYGVSHWNAFFNALIYISDRQKYPLQLILREILLQSKTGDMMDSASESIAKQQLLVESLRYAVILVASLPVLMLYPLIQRYFVNGVMVGAIKG